jgi:serine protease
MRSFFGWPRVQGAVLLALATVTTAMVFRSDLGASQPVQVAGGYDLAGAYLEARANGWNFLPGRAIVKFRPGATSAARQRALRALRGQPSDASLAWIGDRAVVGDEIERDARILVQRLREQPEVESADLDYIRRLPVERSRLTLVDDPDARAPFGTPNDSQFAQLQWNFSMINMPSAWDINPGGSDSLIVAVVDTGVTTVTSTQAFRLYTGASIQTTNISFAVNPDLPESRLVSPADFIFNTAPRTPANGPVLDMDGHGTHVSGTIAEETNNALRVAGIAYRVKIMPVKVCIGYWELMILNAESGRSGFLIDPDDGFCTASAIVAGIRYAADNGAKVINLSLGGTGATPAERDAIAYAVSKGAFVAIAAGNEFEDGNPVTFPASYAASIDGAMAVGAIGKSQSRAYYSTTGSFVEIAAPGGDARTPGSGDDLGRIWQATLSSTGSSPFLNVPNFGIYATVGYQGTSMAAPHVAGLAALIMSQGVTDPKVVEKIIRATAKDLGAKGKDDDFGYGLIQPRAALFGQGVRK